MELKILLCYINMTLGYIMSYTILYSMFVSCVIVYCIRLFCVMYYIVVYFTVLDYIVLYCITPYCIISISNCIRLY